MDYLYLVLANEDIKSFYYPMFKNIYVYLE